MGLTVHFGFRTARGVDSISAASLIRQLHQFCEDRPFAQVAPELTHLQGADACDFERAGRDDPLRWMKIQARESIVRRLTLWHPSSQDVQFGHRAGTVRDVGFDVKPIELIGFTACPGEGCEPLELGLARYPDRIDFYDCHYSKRSRKRALRTGLSDRWRWRAFCKTQYASNHGLEHFLRCHLLVVSVLDRAKALGILHGVSDEGGYWRRRRLDLLAQQLAEYNAIVGTFAKLLKAAAPDPLAVASAIEQHPEYEQLQDPRAAAQFPELQAAVERALRFCRVQR